MPVKWTDGAAAECQGGAGNEARGRAGGKELGWGGRGTREPREGRQLESLVLRSLRGGASLLDAGGAGQHGGLRWEDPERGCEQEGERTLHTLTALWGEEELWRIPVPSARHSKPRVASNSSRYVEEGILCSLNPQPGISLGPLTHMEEAVSCCFWESPRDLPR